MDDSGDGGEIGETVEAVPVFASELADGPGGGSKRQWNHERPGGETGGNEAALGYVIDHGREAEAGVEPDIGKQVKAGIEECVEAEHAAEADDPCQRWDETAHRRKGERDDEQPQGSATGEKCDRSGRVRTEIVLEQMDDEPCDGC